MTSVTRSQFLLSVYPIILDHKYHRTKSISRQPTVGHNILYTAIADTLKVLSDY